MPSKTINNATLAYDQYGQGDPILFIHGIFVSRTQWQHQVNHFSPNHQVVTCDLRGHGQSDFANGSYSVDLLADDLNKLLDELELESVVVCGHSFGGLVAQELALSYPERVRGLVLAETMYGVSTTPWELAMTSWVNMWMPLMVGPESYYKMMAYFFGIYTPGATSYILDEGQRHLAHYENAQKVLRASMMFNSRWRLGRIKCPTLIVVGQYPHIPLIWLQSYEMLWRIRNASMKVIPGAGHILHWDNPSAFNQIVEEFVNDL